jgi:lysophospholipase L1-like esterase
VLVKSPPIEQGAKVESTTLPLNRAKTFRLQKRFALGPLQGLIYAALCFLGLELLFAAAHVGESEYLMPDPVTGYKLMPNKVITQRLEGFGSFKTNSFGMQNDEISLQKPADVLRIAVFGDSYIESLQVARDKNFMQILAQDLGEKLHKKVQVLNFGVSGYSVAQDYLRYKTLAKQFKPDLVIQSFRVEESDKLLPRETRYLSLVRPVFFVGPHGELVYDDTNVRSFLQSSSGKNMVKNEWLRRNSRLWSVAGLISQNLQSFKNGSWPSAPVKTGPVKATAADSDSIAGNKARYISCYWYMMDKQLQSFHDQCALQGTAFMILRLPTIKAEMDSLRSNDTETKLLYQTAAKIGAPILNLDAPFKKQFGTKNDSSHFLPGGHFNTDMHRWVGTNLADYLAQSDQKLVPAEAAMPGPVSK